LLANHLRLNLYRIDLSAVASKYIGETAKNLRRLFDAAEDGSAILFFDEADALFGKRSEVKDACDCDANTEIDYLLQRMGGLSGTGHSRHQYEERAGSGLYAAAAFRGEFPLPRNGRAQGDLGESLPSGDPHGGARFRPARPPQFDRRAYPEHRPQRRLPRGPRESPELLSPCP
jgi:ATPase family protein associated with various cellular activities (AAA)